jgi:hypothetical protein
VGAEGLGGGAELAGEVVGEPVREGEAERERGGLFLDEGEWLREAREPGGLGGGESGEELEEGLEERGCGGLGRPEVEAEPAPPQAHVEDSLGEGLALLPGEVAVGPEGPVQYPLRGLTGENAPEGLRGHRGQPIEGQPGERAETCERIEADC